MRGYVPESLIQKNDEFQPSIDLVMRRRRPQKLNWVADALMEKIKASLASVVAEFVRPMASLKSLIYQKTR